MTRLPAGPIAPPAAGIQLKELEEPNRVLDRRRPDVQVALRRRQVLMPREFLNRSCRCAVHRQMRAECVTQMVRAARRPARPGRLGVTCRWTPTRGGRTLQHFEHRPLGTTQQTLPGARVSW
jgi:hypothetical protein